MGWIVVVVAVVLAGWLVVTYNRLVERRNRVQESWAGIDVQLQRRADLVPNLVQTVKGYAAHERQLLERVTEARASLTRASSPEEAGRADLQLGSALRTLFAVAEDYPELRADRNFLQLQRELAAIEEEIAFARRYYNAVVEEHNTGLQRFPTLLVAGLLGFSPREYFQAGADAEQPPVVELDR